MPCVYQRSALELIPGPGLAPFSKTVSSPELVNTYHNVLFTHPPESFVKDPPHADLRCVWTILPRYILYDRLCSIYQSICTAATPCKFQLHHHNYVMCVGGGRVVGTTLCKYSSICSHLFPLLTVKV